MKKLNLYLLAMIMMVIPVLQSCDDDGYSLGKFTVRMATVRVLSGNTYYLEIDNGKTLWPSATQIPWYKPVDGQRVWADYTPLGSLESYDEAIRVNHLWNVLTKTVEELTEENEAEYGNDPVYIEEGGMWIGGNYLNVEFIFNIPYNKAHRVSLVTNTTNGEPVIDEEGYVHLEYRYNNQNDESNYAKYSYVSFNLGEYGPKSEVNTSIVGLKLKINSIVNGEKEIVFKYVDTAGNTKIQEYTSDVVTEGTE